MGSNFKAAKTKNPYRHNAVYYEILHREQAALLLFLFFFFWETDIESETLLSWGRSGLFWIDCHVAEMRAVHQVYSILWVKDNK